MTEQGIFGGKISSAKHKLKEKFKDQSYGTDKELIIELATRLGISAEDSRFFINEFVDSVRDVVEKHVGTNIRKFGFIHVVSKRNAKYRNPRTGVDIIIPLRYYIKFRPATSFKNFINQKVKKNMRAIFDARENKGFYKK